MLHAFEAAWTPAPVLAADLYDAACLYALAADLAERNERRTGAACSLVYSLAAELPPGRLWRGAPDDPQLRTLHCYLTRSWPRWARCPART